MLCGSDSHSRLHPGRSKERAPPDPCRNVCIHVCPGHTSLPWSGVVFRPQESQAWSEWVPVSTTWVPSSCSHSVSYPQFPPGFPPHPHLHPPTPPCLLPYLCQAFLISRIPSSQYLVSRCPFLVLGGWACGVQQGDGKDQVTGVTSQGLSEPGGEGLA